MKKRSYLLFLTSLFSLTALAGCGGKGDSSSGGCDPMFGCESSSSSGESLIFEDDESTSYEFVESSNADGSVSYEIFVRSFYDSNGDGIGDFRGLEEKLDYLAYLGVKTLWLMPIHESPTYHGYDVTDYYSVNSDFGTMADFESLTATAAGYNIDIMIDMVLNHSSDEHPWFRESLEDYATNNTAPDSKKDWYSWGEGQGATYYGGTRYPYEANFGGDMPDLNLDCPAVRDEIEKITKFWIEKGVKGYRLDAIKYYYFGDNTANCEFLTWLSDTAHKYDPNFYMVGEDWGSTTEILDHYNSKCDSFFKFSSSRESSADESIINTAKGTYSATKFAKAIESLEAKMKENNPNGYSSYFLSNHDMDRVSDSLTNARRAKLAAALYLLLPGTPFIYYGEEISMKGKRVTSPDDLSDARRRLAMIWSEENKTGECGFPEPTRPDLDNNEQVKLGVYDHQEDGLSLLNFYKYIISIRNNYPFMKQGIFTDLCEELNTENNKILAYKISLGEEYINVIFNFGLDGASVDMIGTEIAHEINVNGKVPFTKDGKLNISGMSGVITK